MREALRKLGPKGADLLREYDKITGAMDVTRTLANGMQFVVAKRRLAALKGQLLTEADSARRWSETQRKLRNWHNRVIDHRIDAQEAILDDAEDAIRTKRPIFGLGERFSRLGKVLNSKAVKGGGKALGAAGVVLGGVDTGRHIRDRSWGDAAFSGMNAAGGGLLLAGSIVGPVGVVVGGTLVVGSLIWDHRQEIGKAARWVGDRLGG